MEMSFGTLFDPWIIDNTAFSKDWFAATMKCDKKCHRCGYCAETLKKVLRRI